MKKNYILIILISFISLFYQCSGGGNASEELIRKKIIQGQFSKAQDLIMDRILAIQKTASESTIDSLRYEIERLDRLKLEFPLDSNQVLKAVRKFIPGAKRKDLEIWSEKKYLESRVIEGKTKYYKNAAENLFRTHPELKKIKAKADSAAIDKRMVRKYVAFPLKMHIERIIREGKRRKKKYLLPVTINAVHEIEVDTNALPPDEIVKCWLPFPREIEGQQYNVKRITSDPHIHIIAENDQLQRTIFLKTYTKPDSLNEADTVKFMVEYEFTTKAVYNDIDPDKITPVTDTTIIQRYTKARPPHIVFNRAVKDISQKIVGDETNPYLMAKKIFTWIDKNIAWSAVREYSTIRSLGLYPFYYMQGDAGVKSFFFMTLCRYNKIPARLVSGWQFQPPTKSLHDWCEIYLEPYGWVPVDVTYGLQDFEDDEKKYFYLGNIDSYRLVFNQDYHRPFIPQKTNFRSDRVDNQRGEVEIEERNLYFDEWDWTFEFEIESTYK